MAEMGELMKDRFAGEIPEEKLERIVKIIIRTVNPDRIILFGSRAKGDHRKGSDIDIAVDGGRDLTHRERRKLKEELDKVAGIYTLDLIFLNEVQEEFKKLIEKTGVILWKKLNC
jgi:predicted nucleotidyltransferase